MRTFIWNSAAWQRKKIWRCVSSGISLSATQIMNKEKTFTISSQSVLVKSGFGPWWFLVPYDSKITNPTYGDGCFMPSLQILIEEVWGQTAEQHSCLAAGKRAIPMETWTQETGTGAIKVHSMVLDHQLVLWTLSGCWEIVCFKSLWAVLSGKESRRATTRLLLMFGCEKNLGSQKCGATRCRQKPYCTFEQGWDFIYFCYFFYWSSPSGVVIWGSSVS